MRDAGVEPQRGTESLILFGSVFWIPHTASGWGGDKERPWVIVVPVTQGRPVVTACPCTTKTTDRDERSLLLPVGTVDGLDRPSAVLLDVRRPFMAADFRDFRHAGRLPIELLRGLRARIDTLAARIGRLSEDAW